MRGWVLQTAESVWRNAFGPSPQAVPLRDVVVQRGWDAGSDTDSDTGSEPEWWSARESFSDGEEVAPRAGPRPPRQNPDPVRVADGWSRSPSVATVAVEQVGRQGSVERSRRVAPSRRW